MVPIIVPGLTILKKQKKDQKKRSAKVKVRQKKFTAINKIGAIERRKKISKIWSPKQALAAKQFEKTVFKWNDLVQSMDSLQNVFVSSLLDTRTRKNKDEYKKEKFQKKFKKEQNFHGKVL